MAEEWSEHQPIYVQLHDRIVERILDGDLAEGEALPSVRQVAARLRINPLTVSKGYQMLVDEGVVEKRRGRGMYVAAGARETLRARERERFLREEWPAIRARMRRLGLDPALMLEEGEREGDDHGR